MIPPLTVGDSPIRAFLVRFALLAVALVAGCQKSDPSGQIVIGHTLPADSPSELQAIRLELDRLNADPPVPGLRWGSIHAEAGKTPEQILGQANRLAAVDRVHVLVGGLSPVHADRLGQVASSEPMLAITLADAPLAPTQSWQFCLGISPTDRGYWLARIARDELKLRRIAVVRSADEPISKSLETFRSGFIAAKGTISEIVATKDEKVDDLLSRLIADGCDGVFLAAPDATAILRAMRNSSIPVFFGGDESSLRFLPGGAGGKTPIYAVGVWSEDPAALPPGAAAWRKTWIDEYRRPPDAAAVLMTDAIRVLGQAIGRTGTFAPNRVRDELMRPGATFDGVLGPLRFDVGQTCHRTAFMLHWDGIAWKTRNRLEPVQE